MPDPIPPAPPTPPTPDPGTPPGPPTPTTPPEAPKNFTEWLEKQDAIVRGLYDTEVQGLKSALKSERDARGTLEKDLRDAAAKAEKGSEAEKQLTGMADRVAESDGKAAFYEAAHGVGVTNLKLAYLVAKQDELFDRKGNPDFEALKKGYPELFGKPGAPPPPPGNAGAGTGGTPPAKQGMNEFIRAAAGIK
jgi:hypothetical protein